ncbi:uncharacterized protein LOC143291873 [Babylonia areolata]|uniref:uncharacterized protein LOC143291873 n=1 Tax=Babylonia areolata TaxID=304850 RepID=UPI003FD1D966
MVMKLLLLCAVLASVIHEGRSGLPTPPSGYHLAEVAGCCGQLWVRTYNVNCYLFTCQRRSYYEYRPTTRERTGLCRRCPSVPYNRLLSYRPSPGPCYCKKEATGCFIPTTTKATVTTTTTKTTTTTTTPTTTNQPRVCPVPPPAAFGRMLGGTPVADSCAVDGIVNFHVGSTQVCNGVLGYNPTTKSNQLFITDFCLAFMKGIIQTQSLSAYGDYNGVQFPITQQTASTPVGNAISTIAPPIGVLPQSRCKTAACLYNKNTMSSIIDFKTCYIASYGYDKKLSDGAIINTGTLKIVNVTKQTTCTTPVSNPAAQCFVATDSNVRGCWGDNGAPVYCRLSITKEPVLYGKVDVIGQPPKQLVGVAPTNMCSTNNEFRVIPLS